MSVTGKQIADLARTFLGTPYIKGGQGVPLTASTLAWLRGRYGKEPYVGADSLVGKVVTDCSGLVTRVSIRLGIAYDGHSHNPAWYAANYKKIKYEELQPGDVCLLTNSVGYAYHAGIYLGNGDVIQATGRAQGTIITHNAKQWNQFRRNKFVVVGNVPPTPPPVTKPETYTVVKGDSWIRIAKRHGFKSYKDLIKLNGGKQFGLRPGMVLKVK